MRPRVDGGRAETNKPAVGHFRRIPQHCKPKPLQSGWTHRCQRDFGTSAVVLRRNGDTVGETNQPFPDRIWKFTDGYMRRIVIPKNLKVRCCLLHLVTVA